MVCRAGAWVERHILIEVLSAADRITRFPEAWQLLDEDIRRCRLNRFPYGLIYTIDNGDILVLASRICIAGQITGAIA
jgi:ParE toxin of type II toxin-antitoxin system, parDE